MSTIDRMIVLAAEEAVRFARRAEEAVRFARRAEDAAWLAWHNAKANRRTTEENLARCRRIAAGPRVDSTPEGTDGPPVTREGQPQG